MKRPLTITDDRVAVTAIAVLAVIDLGFMIYSTGPVPLLVLGIIALAMARTLRRTDSATLVFFFVFYTNVLVVASQFHGVPSIIASTFVFILAIPLTRYLVIERGPLVFTFTTPLILAYLAAMLVSSAFSRATAETLGVVGSFVLEGLILYLLLTNTVRTKGLLREITWVLIAAATLMALISVFQEITHSYSNNFGGLAQVSDGGFNVATTGTAKVLRNRLAGPIGEQNRYAQILLVVVPLAYFRYRAEAALKLRLITAGCTVVILAGVLLTFSRGAAVATGLLIIGLAVTRFISLRQLVVTTVIMVAAVTLVSPEFTTRLASLGNVDQATQTDNREADGAVRGRATENLAAWNTFRAHPWVGVGPDRFFRDYSRIEANKLGIRYLDTNRRAHNLYLEMAADLGLLGLAIFLTLNGYTVGRLMKLSRSARNRDIEQEMMAAGLAFALLAYLGTAVFLQLSYQRYYWALLAICNSAIWIMTRSAGTSRRPTPSTKLEPVSPKFRRPLSAVETRG